PLSPLSLHDALPIFAVAQARDDALELALAAADPDDEAKRVDRQAEHRRDGEQRGDDRRDSRLPIEAGLLALPPSDLAVVDAVERSEEHTSELQSRSE